MSSKPLTPLQRAWYRWKALRLPWRKKFLVGLDLSGATFWEFTDALSRSPTRMRRIVEYPRKHNIHYSDVSSQLSPAWHQWLRHTRLDPPSLTEQSQDLVRREQLKILAAQADARWAAKKRLSDMPGSETGQTVPSLELAEGSKTRPEGKIDAEAEGSGKIAESERRTNVEGSRIEKPKSGVWTPEEREHSSVRGKREPQTVKDGREDPWKRAMGGPSEEWQPQAWNPDTLAQKR